MLAFDGEYGRAPLLSRGSGNCVGIADLTALKSRRVYTIASNRPSRPRIFRSAFTKATVFCTLLECLVHVFDLSHARSGRRAGIGASRRITRATSVLGAPATVSWPQAPSRAQCHRSITRQFSYLPEAVGNRCDASASRLCSGAPKSTAFVEALWRRREPVPAAR